MDSPETSIPSMKERLREFIASILLPRFFAVPDCTEIRTLSQVSVTNSENRHVITDFITGNLQDQKEGFFILATKKETRSDDRIYFCITRINKPPALLYDSPISNFFSRLPGRTTYFTKFTESNWDDPNLKEQRSSLSNTRIQLWDIKPDLIPEELKSAFENGELNISKLIDLAYEDGYHVYIANQGSFLRGPLPIPGWIEKPD